MPVIIEKIFERLQKIITDLRGLVNLPDLKRSFVVLSSKRPLL